MRSIRSVAVAALFLAVPSPELGAQGNILMPVDSIERRLTSEPFEVVDRRASRGLPGERTSRTALAYPDGTILVAKWARAAPGGEDFNNVPRFEIGAYEIQKLFLDEDEYVVPPTVARAFSLERYRELDPDDPDNSPTFRGTSSVLVALQYWLFSVTSDDFWDEARMKSDPSYARHIGNFNILTYLIRHGDENEGNYLISTLGDPRVFSVDNGVAFSSRTSDRGHQWRRLQVDRLPAATVERLRSITLEDLTRQLETLVEYVVLADGTLVAVEPSPSLDGRRGVRRVDDRIQLGLTDREIGDLWSRLRSLLRMVDRGRVAIF